MVAKQWAFVPENIEVNLGDTVQLIIESVDVDHGISINTPFLSINRQLPVNQEEVIEFTATETGSWDFSCSVMCGSGHGQMGGTLIVE